MQSRRTTWPWGVAALAVIGVAGWVFRDDLARLWTPGPAQVIDATSAGTATPPPASAAPESPPIAHPLPLDAAADPALPGLDESDAAVWSALTTLFPADGALALVLRDHLIQRLVTHIDNLTEPRVMPATLALKPVAGSLQLDTDGDRLLIGAANSARYAPFVEAFTRADPDALAAAYVRFYPLIQQTYAGIARPGAYFNDRLVVVIDHLLQAPEPGRPLQVEPDGRGKYRFVDPALQSLSVGQKVLLRMDVDQAAAVKRQLRALRVAITRG